MSPYTRSRHRQPRRIPGGFGDAHFRIPSRRHVYPQVGKREVRPVTFPKVFTRPSGGAKAKETDFFEVDTPVGAKGQPSFAHLGPLIGSKQDMANSSKEVSWAASASLRSTLSLPGEFQSFFCASAKRPSTAWGDELNGQRRCKASKPCLNTRFPANVQPSLTILQVRGVHLVASGPDLTISRVISRRALRAKRRRRRDAAMKPFVANVSLSPM